MVELVQRVEQIITPSVQAMGYELVRVQLMGAARPVLQIMAERLDGHAMTVEDCADISRSVSALLDVEDPIASAYTLEVSSPGIDRPLTRPKDFVRFAGMAARIETTGPLEGRRRFTGTLGGLDDSGAVVIEIDQQTVAVPFALIHRAKLVLTPELLKAAAAAQGVPGFDDP